MRCLFVSTQFSSIQKNSKFQTVRCWLKTDEHQQDKIKEKAAVIYNGNIPDLSKNRSVGRSDGPRLIL